MLVILIAVGGFVLFNVLMFCMVEFNVVHDGFARSQSDPTVEDPPTPGYRINHGG